MVYLKKLRNLITALVEQGPPVRFIRNFFITRNAWGMFHRNSHVRQDTGKVKVEYSRNSAHKAALSLSKKFQQEFSPYKCVFCDGYHVGKNQKQRQ